MKYLIVGLGNIGDEYTGTRHNIGFEILNRMADEKAIVFSSKRYAFYAQYKYKGRLFILIKPTTYVNLSGKAVNYWLQKENLAVSSMLVLVDDIALPFGKIRLRGEGSNAGHNGLKNIEETLGHQQYARLRFGIGNDFPQGKQVDYVLGKWTNDEYAALGKRIEFAIDVILSFGTAGLNDTMNKYNNRE